MNGITRTITGIIAAMTLLTAVSCQKDDTLRYNNYTMGNIVDGKFVSDQGNTFTVVEQNCPGKLDTMKRAIVLCDVLYQEADGSYAVRLNNMQKVLTKSPLMSSTTTDEDILKKDPLILSDMWISGGYINMKITIPVKVGSKTPHTLNLMLDDSAASEGKYTFSILHNAEGEILSSESNNSNMVLANAFASFPMTSIIKEEEAEIKINWKSYKISNQFIVSSETIDRDVTISYKKGSFEQIPEAPVAETFNLN